MIVGGVKCRSCSVDQGIAVTKVLSYQKNFREKFGFSAELGYGNHGREGKEPASQQHQKVLLKNVDIHHNL